MPLIVPVVSTPAAPPAESSSAGAATSQNETGPSFSDALSRAGKAAPSSSASSDSAKAQKPSEASSSDAKATAQAQGKADSPQMQSSAPSQDSAAANASASALALQTSGALEAAMAAAQSGKTLPQDDRKTAPKDASPAAVPGPVLAAMLQAPVATSVAAPIATPTAEAQDAKTLPTSALLAGPQNDPLTDRQANFGRAGAPAGVTTGDTTKGAESLPAWMQNLAGSAADAAQPSRFAALHQSLTTASDLSALQAAPSNHADATPSVVSPTQIGQALTLGMPQANQVSQTVWAATVPAHMGSPDWGQAMNQQVLLAAQGQQQFATLHLNPPQLGPLEVHLQMHDGQIQAQFVSAHAVVRQAVEAALPQLRDVFAGAGLSLGQTSVGTQGGQGDRQQARSQRGTSGSNAIADIAAGGAPGASAAQVLRWQQGLVNTYV
ncbi:putative flagellar hook-length control protein FliK [Thiomonas arsenitoxydans]|uniref:Flagellar hook-length control protein FliK n=1 Tax=Thiomonas arsenitoxydans (strain DSM 22701 / CIP 110005 / 3As) TaxID=426114 RepID=D6CQF0_THIA3|nr:flagellar hook-length control protein FliK [Thiomonas arsenitoxydans]CAZ88230.1 putative flagellar hook-length control protein FliK [Thiomonas arsenitoxydans]CQR32809.1 putative flagellar hook-length control protein FliK [Thiomonas arsenitoxydans]CQR33089.1 putative flagellar hook-length control protein FliK [Thiomonas arsenitoxydans]CQR33869.1 putative flagellar hook-length control protein FliK [Thiomonas arsenitoxydans]CQR40214.1 putative flagellar hook-length control protein FliK [Thiomo